MEVRIVNETPKTLICNRLTMSLSKDRTVELWQNFMPFRKAINCKTTTDLISLQNYRAPFLYQEFKANTLFEKWADFEALKVIDIPKIWKYIICLQGYVPFLFIKEVLLLFTVPWRICRIPI